jgi:hypothetical protein
VIGKANGITVLAWIPGITAQRLPHGGGGCSEFLSHFHGILGSVGISLISSRRADECRPSFHFIYAMYYSRDLLFESIKLHYQHHLPLTVPYCSTPALRLLQTLLKEILAVHRALLSELPLTGVSTQHHRTSNAVLRAGESLTEGH